MSGRTFREWGSVVLAAVALAAAGGSLFVDRAAAEKDAPIRERLAAVEARLAAMQDQLNRIENRLNRSPKGE